MPVTEKVAPEDAAQRVQDALGEAARDVRVEHGHVVLTSAPQDLPEVARKLRDSEGIACRFFTFLSAIDWSEFGSDDDEKADDRELEVLLHVYSPEHVIHVNVHVPLTFDDPTCRSVSDVYAGALWHERETYEMFGIHFEGHPNLVKLYLTEDFEGNPLRKSFKLPTRMVKPWPGAKDPEEAAGGGRS